MRQPRLLLDEIYHPVVAAKLAERGHDVVAIAADPYRAGMADEDVLGIAADEGRCLVTENVRDFEILRSAWARDGRHHAGLLYAHRSRFPRQKGYIGKLVRALDKLIAAGDVPSVDQVDWLA